MERLSKNDQITFSKFMMYPKFLLEERFSGLKPIDREVYVLFRDRWSLSLSKEWIDDCGDVFFIFSNKNIAKILNVSEKTIIKSKKILKSYGLIEEDPMFEKDGSRKANAIYLTKIPLYPTGKSSDTLSQNISSPMEKIQINNTKINNTDKSNILSSRNDYSEESIDISNNRGGGLKRLSGLNYSKLNNLENIYFFKTGYHLRHDQKMDIGLYLEDEIVVEEEVINFIYSIPDDSGSPLAYLLECLEGEKEKIRMMNKQVAHKEKIEKYI